MNMWIGYIERVSHIIEAAYFLGRLPLMQKKGKMLDSSRERRHD